MCSLAAAVQGMDETVNNGAQAIYLDVISPPPPRLKNELGSSSGSNWVSAAVSKASSWITSLGWSLAPPISAVPLLAVGSPSPWIASSAAVVLFSSVVSLPRWPQSGRALPTPGWIYLLLVSSLGLESAQNHQLYPYMRPSAPPLRLEAPWSWCGRCGLPLELCLVI